MNEFVVDYIMKYKSHALRWAGLRCNCLVIAVVATLICINSEAAIPPAPSPPDSIQEQVYRDSIAINPADERAVVLLAALLGKRGDSEQAVQILQAGVRANPGSAVLRVTLGSAEQSIGKLQPALTNFTAALDLPGLNAEMAVACMDGFMTAGALDKACAAGKSLLSRFPSHERVADRVLKAMERSKQYAECLHLANKLLEQYPSWDRIRYRQARSLRLSGFKDKANDIYLSLLDKTKFDYDVCNELGSLCSEAGELDKAETFYKRGLKSKPTGSALLYNYADLLFRECKDAATAAPLYRKARIDDPYFEIAFLGEIDALRALGQADTALEVCAEATRMLPWRPQAYFKAAELLHRLARYDEAAEWLQKGLACTLVTDSDRSVCAYCLNTFDKGELALPILEQITNSEILASATYCHELYIAHRHTKVDEALLERVKGWQQRFPKDRRFYLGWGHVAYMLNNLDEVVACIGQFELHDPPGAVGAGGTKEFLLLFYSELSLRKDDPVVIAQTLETLIRLYPDNDKVRFESGRLAKRLGRYQDAVQHWLEAVRLNPRNSRAYSELGRIIRDPMQGLPFFQKAVEVDPKCDILKSNLGFRLILCRRGEEAVKTLLEAVETNSKNAVAWYNLALAYTFVKEREKATGAYNKAVELDYSGNPDLQAQLDTYLRQNPIQ